MSESNPSKSDIFNQIATDFFEVDQIHRQVQSQRLRARPEANAFAPPRTPLEELLGVMWEGVLGVKRAGVHDNFFELGGNS
ncbi:MAG TPA: hypothetical protein VEZ90_11245, partial [Blastocatellia bacterium]|nr:hypothetical protein [Blastocatellia bacterium]